MSHIHRNLRRIPGIITWLAILLLASCGQSADTARSPEWDTFVNQYMDAFFEAQPNMGAYVGRHEFDGRLPDWSAAGIQHDIERLHAQQDRARAFEAGTLSHAQQFERDYLIAATNGELFWLEKARWPFKNPSYYSWALDPNVYVTREYAPLDQRLRAYTAFTTAVPTAVGQIRHNLETPMPKPYVRIGMIIFGGLADYFENDVPGIFSSVVDDALQAEFREANAAAAAALRGLVAWLEEQMPQANSEYAIGPELYLEMLSATEGVNVSIAQLKRIGEEDLQRNLDALRIACEQFAPGKSIEEAVQMMRDHKPPEGSLEGARRQLGDLKTFLMEQDLVTIPGPEEALVAEAPPYMRWNFAFIDIPGPYEENLPSTYYIAPPDPTWSEKDQQDYLPGDSDLLFTSVHEVWPGHFLQHLHAGRATSRFGQVFVGYAFSEGWAHYTEELMIEAGLGRDNPEHYIGQLLNALLRNVRFLSSIGLHADAMSVEESERMFVESGYQDFGTARQQAARGTFDPAYLNYTLGKLMIRKLRDDWCADRGGRAAWREFHDTFLSYGGPPIPLVRRDMLGPDGGPAL